MSIFHFLKLQWVKRKIIIMMIVFISVAHFIFASNYRSIQFKAMNILTGDHYYTSFTVMLPADDEMTALLIKEVKGWSGVANVSLLNTQKLMKQIKKDTQQYGLELPAMVTDSKTLLYSIQIDPFAKKELVEAMKMKIIGHFPTDNALASPIKYAEVSNGNFNFLTLFFMEHGVTIIFILLSLIIIGANALLFYKMVRDAYILQSINRTKALSLKNYLYFQLGILVLAMVVLTVAANSISVLTILIWITMRLYFMGFGVKTINCEL